MEVHFTPSVTLLPAKTSVKARDSDRFQLVTVEFNRLPFGIMFSKGKQVGESMGAPCAPKQGDRSDRVMLGPF